MWVSLRSMQLNEQKQRLEISTLSSQLTKLRNELNDYNLMQIELTRKADAEAESASISRDKANEALRSKQHLESQVAALKEAHEGALKRCEDLEEEAVHLNGRIMTLQGDLAVLNDKLRSKDQELNGAEGQRAVAAEVESLRAQLSEMRKKLLRKDLDNEVDKISPAAAMERDRNSRRVYESIIEDLRHQLDTTTSALHDANQRLSDARARLLRMDELQEEMELYKETAKKVAIESHR
jgi:chromosome segregation ATPase